MRNKSVMGVVGLTVLAALTACGTQEEADGRSKSPNVKVTAKCTSTNQIDVAVDNWVAVTNPGGVTNWKLDPGGNPATDADVTIEPKGGSEPWPFQETGAFKPGQGGGTNKNIRADAQPKKTYKYNIRVVCGAQTVLIDPDIFVD